MDRLVIGPILIDLIVQQTTRAPLCTLRSTTTTVADDDDDDGDGHERPLALKSEREKKKNGDRRRKRTGERAKSIKEQNAAGNFFLSFSLPLYFFILSSTSQFSSSFRSACEGHLPIRESSQVKCCVVLDSENDNTGWAECVCGTECKLA